MSDTERPTQTPPPKPAPKPPMSITEGAKPKPGRTRG